MADMEMTPQAKQLYTDSGACLNESELEYRKKDGRIRKSASSMVLGFCNGCDTEINRDYEDDEHVYGRCKANFFFVFDKKVKEKPKEKVEELNLNQQGQVEKPKTKTLNKYGM